MTNGSDTYRALFDIYLGGYRTTSTPFRSDEENKKIDQELTGFGTITSQTDQLLGKLSSQPGDDAEDEAENMTTLLRAGLGTVSSIFVQAVKWDEVRIKSASVASQAGLRKVAVNQETTDQKLLANLGELVGKAATALARAAGETEPKPDPRPAPSKQSITAAAKELTGDLAKQTPDITEQMVIEDDSLSGIDAPDAQIDDGQE